MDLEEIREVVERFSASLAEVGGDHVVSAYLFGSVMIAEDFHRGISDINTFIVLSDLSGDSEIPRLRLVYRRFGKYPFSPPLVLRESELTEAARLFPVEFSEMKDRHLQILGRDTLTPLPIPECELRRQCRMEVKARIIGLRKLLFAGGDIVKQQDVLFKTLTSSILILKQALRLKGIPIPSSRTETIERLEEITGRDLKGIKNLYAMRAGSVRLTKNIAERILLDYLSDIERFSDVFDE